jgi:hypothetical protein
MSGFIVVLVIIVGVGVYAYFKIPAFKQLLKNIGGSGGAQVSKNEVDKLSAKLLKEQERTKQLADWAQIQTDINAERTKQAASLKILKDGKK